MKSINKYFQYVVPIIIATSFVLTTCEKDKLKPVISVSTGNASNISYTECTANGTISSIGEGIKQHGFCWSETSNPTINNNKIELGVKSTTGPITGTLTNLTQNTTYYVRAYAKSNDPVVYGDAKSFKTKANTAGTLTTNNVGIITKKTASCGGNIIDDGGVSITARGVCWSTSKNPTTADSKTTDESGMGSYTSELTNLSCGTTYYVRAYATNSVGTAYGPQITFTTSQCEKPIVTTKSISYITYNSAKSGGNVTDDGGAPVTARGVCWSASGSPTISDSKTTNDSGIGSFNSTIANLTPSTKYYVRAYATNSIGTAYGNEIGFKTETSIKTITLLPSSDNYVVKFSLDDSYEKSVYASSDLGVGNYWIPGFYVSSYALYETYIKFILPNQTTNKTIISAELKLYVRTIAAEPWATEYKIAAQATNWSGSTITWNNSRGMTHWTSSVKTLDPPVTDAIPFVIDVTSIVQSWVNGTWNNYGFRLWDFNYPWPIPNSIRTTIFWSKEVYDQASHRPRLVIEYEE